MDKFAVLAASATTIALVLVIVVVSEQQDLCRTALTSPSSQALAPSRVHPSSEDCERSLAESRGLFCESNQLWSERQELRFAQFKRQRSERLPDLSDDRFWQRFWSRYWDPEFSCALEKRVGPQGEGGRWICDPRRMADAAGDDCLVYSVNPEKGFGFEQAVQKEFPRCEVHAFGQREVGSAPQGIHYHNLGVGGADDAENDVYTITTLRGKLGHGSRRTAILKIDVEGWEYDVLIPEFLGDDGRDGLRYVDQVLVETHRPAKDRSDLEQVHRFFESAAQDGFVIFHKEANVVSRGEAIEYAFLRLRNSPRP